MQTTSDAKRLAIRSLLIGLLGISSLHSVSVARTAEMAGSPSVGPFRLGMSLDEIKMAVPAVKWRDDRIAAFSGRVTGISSIDTVEIAGMAFHVQAQVPYYYHGLKFEATTQEATATTCEQSVVTWLTKVEAQLGPFRSLPRREVPAGPNSLQWNVQRNAAGSVNVTPSMSFGTPARVEGDIIKFGQQSSLLVEAFDDEYRVRSRKGIFGGEPENLKLTAVARGDRHRVDIKAEFREASMPNCLTEVAMEQWTQPPAPRIFDADNAKLVSKQSIAERHWAWVAFAPAPTISEGIDVQLRCQIETALGQTRGCGVVAPPNLNRLHAAVAMRMANGLTYDMKGIDRDDPQPMQTTIKVRLEPTDRKPIDFLSETRTPLSELIWEDEPDAYDFNRAFPLGLAGTPDEVSVALTCQVQDDGSLVCGDATLADIPSRQEFVFAATRLASLGYRASAKLRNGQLSKGRVLLLVITLLR
jgi:hypothetical protein